MEYERIHKVQTGIISPSKLRMKLMSHQRKKDGSNSNSGRTSPSKLEDTEFVKNGLLASNSGVFDEEVSSMEVSSLTADHTLDGQGLGQIRGVSLTNVGSVKTQNIQKTDSCNLSSVHPLRTLEDENLDYDSNASSSSFEFHKGERMTHHAISRSLLRPMSSKWNDAEKWIMNRQNVSHNSKNSVQNQGNRAGMMNGIRVAPESATSIKRVDFCQPALEMGAERFSFDPCGTPHPIKGQAGGSNELIDPCPESQDFEEVDKRDLSCGMRDSAVDTGDHGVRSVSMRDMGTEMTPISSQEPSMNSTPVGATTPLRSPTSSIPSTPRRGAPNSTPIQHTTNDDLRSPKKLSEEELKLKTRKEILELGVQLGKTNIAAWASNKEKEKNASAVAESNILAEESLRIEFEKRAAAWEDAEKSKHNARFKREEIKIQAWESQQKAKLEAEVRRIEAQFEQRRAYAQAKMVKKIAMARQRSEAKRAAAAARKNRQAEKAAAQAEYIRQTGRLPSPYICCGWSS